MDWTADALILSRRAYGESSAIIDLFTREHGRYAGLVRGGNARRLRPVLQSGNMVQARWRARLAEHLGTIVVEGKHPYAAALMADALKLAALSSLCALLHATPERHAYPRLYDTALVVLDNLLRDMWLPVMVRFELALLEETGFGLDLASCAVSGELADTTDLTHVSPRSGRAVSRAVAAPYIDKLLRLPRFLLQPEGEVSHNDIKDGFALTGYFLEQRLYAPHQTKLPPARTRLVDLVQRQNNNS